MSYAIKKFFENSENFLGLLKTKKESFWLKRGDAEALNIFKYVLSEVPAYQKFLKSNKRFKKKYKFKHNTNLFKDLPSTDKDCYLRKYPYESLMPGGKFPQGNFVFSATSGSTGEPFYFPRKKEQDLYYALTAELYLRTNFDIQNKKTLYINGFALGIWIGGLFTYQAIKHIAEKGKYNLTIANPGTNKEEMLKVIKKIGVYYDQVIIGGYPPFIKDFVDYSNEQKFDWRKIEKKFIFSAEGFSEEFRDYIAKNTYIKNIYKDTLNHYGTVDLGTMAHETPISILIRRLALKNKEFYNALFGVDSRLPTLAQYIPEFFFFEEINGCLYCSANSGIPLIRYNLKDLGGVKKFGEVFEIAIRHGINLKNELKKAKIEDTTWELPFVYVFERSDLSVSFYGANVYPETIKPILLSDDFKNYLTGRFFIEIKHSDSQDPNLLINIEARNKDSLNSIFIKKLEKIIFDKLMKENSEYHIIYKSVGYKALPRVFLWEKEGHFLFKRIGKQKWVKK